MDKQNNKALAGVNVEKMTIDATINQKQMTSVKVMLLMNNTETKEALDITIDFDLRNVNEDVKVKEVEVKDYSVVIDGMGFSNNGSRIGNVKMFILIKMAIPISNNSKV